MRRLITLFFLVFTLSGVAFAQQMSDDQGCSVCKKRSADGQKSKADYY